MGETVELTTSDNHVLSAYVSAPGAAARGGVVVIQEIFGVTRHIRAVADQYASQGYLCVAPALFDRVERGVDLPYSDVQRGLSIMKAVNMDLAMRDVDAGITRVAGAGKVGIVGYCWGGLVSYLAAARLGVDAAIAYYGGGIHLHLADKPRAPIMFHYGERDTHIPLATVDAIRSAVPSGTFHVYPADHGFNCTDRASFEPRSAQLAFARSVEFFRQHLG